MEKMFLNKTSDWKLREQTINNGGGISSVLILSKCGSFFNFCSTDDFRCFPVWGYSQGNTACLSLLVCFWDGWWWESGGQVTMYLIAAGDSASHCENGPTTCWCSTPKRRREILLTSTAAGFCRICQHILSPSLPNVCLQVPPRLPDSLAPASGAEEDLSPRYEQEKPHPGGPVYTQTNRLHPLS